MAYSSRLAFETYSHFYPIISTVRFLPPSEQAKVLQRLSDGVSYMSEASKSAIHLYEEGLVDLALEFLRDIRESVHILQDFTECCLLNMRLN